MIVVDASALLELLLGTPSAPAVRARLEAATTWHAPQLLDLEIAQVLRRIWCSGALSDGRGDQALADFRDLAIERWDHGLLLPRIWQLRGSLTAYDAGYVALAEALDAPLLTCDRRLGRAHGHAARLVVV